jgi:hypothetical protein
MKRSKLVGQTFGRLTVLSFSHLDSGQRTYWRCQCTCGNTHVGQGHKLTSGELVSCGCYQKERQRESGRQHRTHGHGHGTQAYKAWQSLKDRCLNPKHRQYSEYGGRGITVHEPWITSFETFLADMGEPPEGMSLDRINNNGPYAPDNCRWTTRYVQQNNQRSTHRITAFGRTQSLSDWALEVELPRETLAYRIRYGWPIEEALTIPKGISFFKKGHKSSKRIRITLLHIAERDNWSCHICHQPVTRKNWSKDHLVPVSKGGQPTLDNFALAHALCNRRKATHILPPVNTQLSFFSRSLPPCWTITPTHSSGVPTRP